MTALETLKSALQEKSHQECLEIARTAGKEETPLYFDTRYPILGTLLPYIGFVTPPETPNTYPYIKSDECWVTDELVANLHTGTYNTLRKAALYTENYPTTTKGEENFQEVYEAFQTSCLDTFNVEPTILDAIKSQNQNISLFLSIIPGYAGDTYLPEGRYAQVDQSTKPWENFKKELLHLTENNISKDELKTQLQELAENATYGGHCGVVVTIKGPELAEWIQTKDLLSILKSRYAKTPEKTRVAIYDFLNGSGHDVDLPLDWNKLQINWEGPCGIINNFIEAVFGLVGNSTIPLPKGSGCWHNIWFKTPNS
jgi:hypothetical protein